MSYEPLHHKYRPQTFADLVGQEAIATTLTNAMLTVRIAPAYLFTGPRGTGKTSSARILAKSLNCLSNNKPTPQPCGRCDVCRGIAKGAALDVIEIDAASNTGVDNIREIIERAQFAPVQCRYKVYAIDECLTGDTLVSTREGTQRIDDPAIVGKQVLSYNDATGTWEYKTVTRWFDQGKRPTLVIKTTRCMIKCTDNHLIRTEQGWIRAINLKVGMKILSPQVASQPATSKPLDWQIWNPFVPFAPAAAGKSSSSQNPISEILPVWEPFKNTGTNIPTDSITAFDSKFQPGKPNSKFWNLPDLSALVDVVKSWRSQQSPKTSTLIPSSATGQIIRASKITTKFLAWMSDWQNWNPLDPSAPVAAASGWISRCTCLLKHLQQGLKGSETTGKDILTAKGMESGIAAQRHFSEAPNSWNLKLQDSSTEPYWETVPSPTPTRTAVFPDWLWCRQKSNASGLSTKPNGSHCSEQPFGQRPIWDMALATWHSTAIQPVIHSLEKFLLWLNPMGTEKLSHWTGSIESLRRVWLGGTWMTVPLNTAEGNVQEFDCILKGSPMQKTSLLLNGSQDWATQPRHSTESLIEARSIPSFNWAQSQPENGLQISDNTLFPQWTTSLEEIESIEPGEIEPVYDIEVEENHNFVGNGLTLHNCHMLSQASFNALLKTLEEPPDRVVFILATTDPQRVLPTIISRCQRFDFRRIPLEAMVQHLKQIATKEDINITPAAVQLVAQVAQGGLRDAESLLDQLSLLSGQVTVERVWDLVGAVAEPDLLALLQAIAQNHPEAVLDCARRVMDRGREPLILLQNLVGFYRDLLIAKTAPSRNDLVAVTLPTWQTLCQQAQAWDINRILAGQQHLAKSEVQLKTTTQPRLWLEVALLGLLPTTTAQPTVSPLPAPSLPQPTAEPINQIQQPNGTKSNGSSPPALLPPNSTDSAIPENPLPPTTEPALESNEAKTSSVESSPPTTVNQASEIPKAEIWQQVLLHLQPISVRELLRQMGQLVEFDGNIARIGMKSPAWCNQAKAYLPNIKAAFQAQFNSEVQVNLELAKATPAKTTSATQSSAPTEFHRPPATPAPAVPATSQGQATVTPQPPTITESPAQTSNEPTIEVNSTTDKDEDEVAIAAERLAKVFKGEVVTLKDASTSAQSTVPNHQPLQLDSEWGNQQEEDDEEF